MRKLKQGDRVIGDKVFSCETCKACLGGNYMMCSELRCIGTINAWDGGFAEVTGFPARHFYEIADPVPLAQAAMIELAAISMYGIQNSRLTLGLTVLVIGTGVIGMIAAAIASISAASNVILSG
jgi:threonine dehydrogenase-like Zn-dependent dehydrogenase